MITRLCIKNPMLGKIKGVCSACGQNTENGFPFPFSENFTGFSYLFHGNCFCPYCYGFFKDPRFRKRSWLATEKEVKFLKRLDCRLNLLDLPEPPFAFYITKAYHRQGWLSGLRCENFSREKFYLLTDFVGTILIESKDIFQMYEIIEFLRGKKISKTKLLTGGFSIFDFRRAINEGWQDFIEKAKAQVKKPLWEVMIYVSE